MIKKLFSFLLITGMTYKTGFAMQPLAIDNLRQELGQLFDEINLLNVVYEYVYTKPVTNERLVSAMANAAWHGDFIELNAIHQQLKANPNLFQVTHIPRIVPSALCGSNTRTMLIRLHSALWATLVIMLEKQARLEGTAFVHTGHKKCRSSRTDVKEYYIEECIYIAHVTNDGQCVPERDPEAGSWGYYIDSDHESFDAKDAVKRVVNFMQLQNCNNPRD